MIYTTYFSKLRNLPPDIVPISITLFPPKNWGGLQYTALAPSPKMLFAFKNGMTEDAYRLGYNFILSSLRPDQVVKDLFSLASGAKDIALVCYEKSSDFCHRHLVAEWLNQHGYHAAEFDFSDAKS